MSVNRLARQLKDQAAPDGFNVRSRQGIVVAVHPGNDPVPAMLDVSIGGVTIEGIPYADSFTPAVDDVVTLQQVGKAFYALCRCKS